MLSHSVAHARTAGLALGGPALLGLALGMPFGLRALLVEAGLMVAIVVGLTVLMLPALYIATTLMGTAPSAQRMGAASIAALRSGGTLLLGLTPASLFLIATSQTALVVWVLGFLVLGASQLTALRWLYSDLLSGSARRTRVMPVFVVWSLVSMGLGAHLFARTLHHIQAGAVHAGL